MRRREFIRLVGGAVAAWPFLARAQQPAMPVVGFLNGASPDSYARMVAAFQQGLKKTGFVEGQNVEVEYHWARPRWSFSGLSWRRCDVPLIRRPRQRG
jgi:hypothetical protein